MFLGRFNDCLSIGFPTCCIFGNDSIDFNKNDLLESFYVFQ